MEDLSLRSKAITAAAALAKIMAVAAPVLALWLIVGVEAAAQQADASRLDSGRRRGHGVFQNGLPAAS